MNSYSRVHWSGFNWLRMQSYERGGYAPVFDAYTYANQSIPSQVMTINCGGHVNINKEGYSGSPFGLAYTYTDNTQPYDGFETSVDFTVETSSRIELTGSLSQTIGGDPNYGVNVGSMFVVRVDRYGASALTMYIEYYQRDSHVSNVYPVGDINVDWSNMDRNFYNDLKSIAL